MDAAPADFRAALGLTALLRKPPRDRLAFGRLVSSNGPLAAITRLCVLLWPGDEQTMSARVFIEQLAPALVQQLRRATRVEREVMHGRARGRVDWSATYKQRYVSDNNPALFVCLPGWRQYDLPENQLFKAVLLGLQRGADSIPAGLRAWRAWGGDAPRDRATGLPVLVGARLQPLAFRLRQLSGAMTLREVTEPVAIDHRHLAAARSSKNELYAKVADFHRFCLDVADAPMWEPWARVVNAVLPLLPREADVAGRLATE